MVVSQRGHCSSGGAAVPVAGQRHELGQGSRGDRWARVRVRVRVLTARARHHVVQPHRLRPRVPPAQRYLGADLRSITHLLGARARATVPNGARGYPRPRGLGHRRTVCSDLVDPLGPVDPLGKHRVTRHTHSVASGVDRARGRIHGEPGLVHPHRPRALGFRPTSAPPTESCNGSWPATNSPLPSSSSPAAASQTYSGDDACSSPA